MVINKPEILIGVKGSWKTMPAADIVTTSLKMPQILRVTTEVRCKRANSEAVMRNASIPGKKRTPMPRMMPFFSARPARPCPNSTKPSTGMAMIARLKNMTGAR
eukprot:GHVO01015509.1.p2 GENE.GHVO01015509.1~~GHVO01015509.1.p2  ORF type:complete len:104 (-),score=8.75 GHVO01015509.1:182-493(-)